VAVDGVRLPVVSASLGMEMSPWVRVFRHDRDKCGPACVSR
jgi:hypothetical protein